MKEIPLVNGMGLALVDDEDYPELSQYQWYLHPGGAMRHVPEDHTTEMMHTRIIGTPGKRITHLDGNHLNNQRANLSRRRPPKAPLDAPACSVCGRRVMLQDGLCLHCRTHPVGCDGLEQKLCPKCQTVKPITDYYRSRGRPSGWCKDCAKAFSKKTGAPKTPRAPAPKAQRKTDEFKERALKVGCTCPLKAPGGFTMRWRNGKYMVVVCQKPKNDTILVPRYYDYQPLPGVRELRVTDPDDLERQMLECPDLLEEVSK